MYRALGYRLFPGFFSEKDLSEIRTFFLEANAEWKKTFPDPRSVNSAYLTSPKFTKDPEKRISLFRFVSQEKLVSLAEELMGTRAYFLNTQIFFNPESDERKPYWHRDMQYLGVSEEEQKRILAEDQVLHFRIPFDSDPGMEFIPRSHLRWDRELELETRLERNGKKNSDPLPEMVRVLQEPGDLLVFSAHLIHRGVYGGERKSLDVLYTSFPDKKSSADHFAHFPEPEELSRLANRQIFDRID